MFSAKKTDSALKVKESDTKPKQVESKSSEIKRATQREIVFSRVAELIKERKITVKKNQPILECLKNEDLEVLHKRVMADFQSGKGKLKDTPANKEKLKDEKKLRAYCKGLCSNWLRRDPLLNGDKEFKS